MPRRWKLRMLLSSGVILLLGIAQLGAAPPEKYAAVAMATSGSMGGRSLSLDIHINQYTSDEEAEELANLLAEQGQNALRLRLERISKGRINPVGFAPNEISVIRAKPLEKGRQIVLVSARVMPWVEMYISGRSRDYNLSWIVLDLDEKGRGTGSVILGARLKIDDEGQLDVTSYGRQFIRLANVRPWN